MENMVTFRAPAEQKSSCRTPAVRVWVEGQEAPALELLQVRRSSGPELNQARFALHPGSTERWEDLLPRYRPGQRIRAEMLLPGRFGRGPLGWPLFSGRIAGLKADLAHNLEAVELSALDSLSWQAQGTVVDGVWATGDAGPVYLSGVEPVFNPGGQGNYAVTDDERDYPLFELNPGKARPWSWAEAIGYLAGQYLGLDIKREPLRALADGQPREVAIAGLSPLEALDRLCRRAGLRFYLEQAPVGEQVEEVLRFYRPGRGRPLHLRHQRAGEALDLHHTNLAGCAAAGRARETIRVIVRGGAKRFESTFALKMGWDRTLEMDNYELYSPATNLNFLQVQDVFRHWVLNEGGDYAGDLFGLGAAYDFTPVFGNGNFARRRRRFWPCLSRDAGDRSLGYHVEVSYNSGAGWWPWAGSFNILLDECGIYLSGSQFDLLTWNAIKKDTLRFRITATVEADEHLEAVLIDGPVGSLRPVRTEVLELGADYAFRQVASGSIFAGAAALGAADTADDGAALRARAREYLQGLREAAWSGTADLPGLRADLWPGAILQEVEGRGVKWRSARCDEAGPQIKTVEINLGQKWTTRVEF